MQHLSIEADLQVAPGANRRLTAAMLALGCVGDQGVLHKNALTVASSGMTVEELHAIVSGGESEQVEFKRTTGQRTDGAKSACGMLNGAGGFVLFGVNDKGVVLGQQVRASTVEELTAALRRIEPSVLLHPEVVAVDDDLSVIALRVPSGSYGPFTYEGRPYVRQGPTTVPMPQAEYRRVLLEQMHPTERWENQAAYQFSIRDIDVAELARTVDEAVRRGRLNEPGTRNPEELLRGFDLMREGSLLNAAVVLFAHSDRVLPFYPQCLLRMARFRGITTTEFEDNRQAYGNAFDLLQKAQSFLREHLPVASRVMPDLFERHDQPLYPLEALREALVNAFCHRDYQAGGGSVSIAVFDDRLEISSTGRLPFGMTVDDLQRPHPSRPWNPLVAGVFYRRGLIEQWGRGTLRISELAREAGLVAPEFEERSGEVVVRFLPMRYVAPRRVDHELRPLQQEVLEVVAHYGGALLSDLHRLLPKVPKRTLQHTLNTLRDLGMVELQGWGRGALWKLVERPKTHFTDVG